MRPQTGKCTGDFSRRCKKVARRLKCAGTKRSQTDGIGSRKIKSPDIVRRERGRKPVADRWNKKWENKITGLSPARAWEMIDALPFEYRMRHSETIPEFLVQEN